MVSHDRYLLDKLTDQLFIFDGEGKITVYNGNYADFKEEEVLREKEAKRKTEAKKTNEAPALAQSERKKRSFKEQREYETVEQEIEQIEKDIASQTELLTNTQDHVRLAEIASNLQRLNGQLDEKTLRWMELAELA